MSIPVASRSNSNIGKKKILGFQHWREALDSHPFSWTLRRWSWILTISTCLSRIHRWLSVTVSTTTHKRKFIWSNLSSKAWPSRTIVFLPTLNLFFPPHVWCISDIGSEIITNQEPDRYGTGRDGTAEEYTPRISWAVHAALHLLDSGYFSPRNYAANAHSWHAGLGLEHRYILASWLLRLWGSEKSHRISPHLIFTSFCMHALAWVCY